MRVQDACDHAFAARQQPATFMVGSALRMGLKREEHSVLNADWIWHEHQSISRRAERGNARRWCYAKRNSRRTAALHEIFQRDYRGALFALGLQQ